METYRTTVSQWNTLLPKVKGNKSHQFTTDTLGAYIYFNSSGVPLNVVDDTPFTNFESHMTEKWYHNYYYNKAETGPSTAINNFRSGTGSIYMDIMNQQGAKINSYECWVWDPNRYWLHGGTYSITELLRNKWYTITDAIS